jgi:hypothetical protein
VNRATGWQLLAATGLLVLGGCALYLADAVGVAQFLWVLASGAAGAGFALILEDQ